MELIPKACDFPIKGRNYDHRCGNFARKGKDFCWMHDGTPKKSERLKAENATLKDGYRQILKEANKPAIHEKSWKNQSREWEESFLVAKLIAEQALKGDSDG